jgi:hypothetical protein
MSCHERLRLDFNKLRRMASECHCRFLQTKFTRKFLQKQSACSHLSCSFRVEFFSFQACSYSYPIDFQLFLTVYSVQCRLSHFGLVQRSTTPRIVQVKFKMHGCAFVLGKQKKRKRLSSVTEHVLQSEIYNFYNYGRGREYK